MWRAEEVYHVRDICVIQTSHCPPTKIINDAQFVFYGSWSIWWTKCSSRIRLSAKSQCKASEKPDTGANVVEVTATKSKNRLACPYQIREQWTSFPSFMKRVKVVPICELKLWHLLCAQERYGILVRYRRTCTEPPSRGSLYTHPNTTSFAGLENGACPSASSTNNFFFSLQTSEGHNVNYCVTSNCVFPNKVLFILFFNYLFNFFKEFCRQVFGYRHFKHDSLSMGIRCQIISFRWACSSDEALSRIQVLWKIFHIGSLMKFGIPHIGHIGVFHWTKWRPTARQRPFMYYLRFAKCSNFSQVLLNNATKRKKG